MKIFNWFKKEKCFACDKILSSRDKKKGGCGFSNDKSFNYCEECSQNLIEEILSGKKPKLQKILENKFKLKTT